MKYLLLASFISISFSTLAYADSSIYASLKAGISDTKMKNNEVNYLFDDGDYYSHENYYQNNQTKSIYPNIAAAIGFDFSKISHINARAELEYSYKENTTFTPSNNYEVLTTTYNTTHYTGQKGRNLFKNDLRGQSIMVNGYYDFKNKSKFTPYISAGAGITYIKNDYINLPYPEYNLSQTDHHFTWSFGVGTAYNITDNVALDLSYKYVDVGKFKFGDNFKQYEYEETHFKLSSQDYSLGIRYNF